MADDTHMERFEGNARRFRARDAVLVVLIALFALVLLKGSSIERTGEELDPGVQRDVLLAVGKPAAWLAGNLPLERAAASATAGLSPDDKLDAGPGFESGPGPTAVAGGLPVVTPDAFSAAALGAKPAPPARLGSVLVTGDSLSQPLDLEIARRLAGKAKVIRDGRLGSGLSKPEIVDWGKLAVTQVKRDRPDAVIVFIGANEGFSMPDPAGKDQACCGPAWASIYANRARRMMDVYRQGGRAHVYWINVLGPKDPKRIPIVTAVNAAVAVAAEPWRDQVEVVDSNAIFTPGGRYRDSMAIDGRATLVRRSDGIHLNDAGAAFLGRLMLDRLGRRYRL